MSMFADTYLELWEKTEWVAISTAGPDGPHVVGAWGDHLRLLNGKLTRTILVPAGGYHRTEANLKQNPGIEVLLATKRVESSRSLGQGCSFTGTGEIKTSGIEADRARQSFPWARGVLVIQIEHEALHL